MGFSRQEYWSGLPCPPPGDLPDPGIKPASLSSPLLADRYFSTHATWEAFCLLHYVWYFLMFSSCICFSTPSDLWFLFRGSWGMTLISCLLKDSPLWSRGLCGASSAVRFPPPGQASSPGVSAFGQLSGQQFLCLQRLLKCN